MPFLPRLAAGALTIALALPLLAAAQFKPILPAAPAPWDAFLAAARRADAIDDPLARCLAFPDWPGNRWPAGLASAYCHTLNAKVLDLATIEAYLARGETARLRDAMRALRTAHSRPGHAETIHQVLAGFSSSEQSGRVAARWLVLQPNDPLAMTARARHVLEQAWDAMLDGNASAVRAPAAQARALLERAIRADASLMPAHAMLIELGMVTADRALIDAAWKRGSAADPGCRELARQKMKSLTPRWGGSVEAMQAFAGELRPLAGTRPLLVNVIAMADLEQANTLLRGLQHDAALELLRRASLEAPYPDLAWRLASLLGDSAATDRYELIATLVGAGRFADDDYATAYERGRQLMQAGDGEWAVRAVRRALVLKPDSLQARQLMGAVYVQAGQPAQAEEHFVAALAEPDLRPLTLRALVASMKNSLHQERTARYAHMLTQEQPESLHGWSVLGHARLRLQDRAGALQAFETYLRLVDRKDAAWAGATREIDKLVAELQTAVPR